MITVTVDFDALRVHDPRFYSKAIKVFKLSSGVHEVDLEALLYWEDRQRLSEFLNHQDKVAKEAAAAEIERQRKIEADTEAYKARILQYVNEQDLQPTAENAEIIRKWLDEHPQINGYKSAQNADAAVSVLRGKLTWKPKVPATPPAPEPPPAVLLSDGSPQLPIDAMPTYKHTKAQLADLAKRQVATQQSRRGWHGASF
jgi:hypothetical protein